MTHRANILVMDDDNDMLELYGLKLRKFNCNIIYTNSADEAINIYSDLLITDKAVEISILDLTIPGGRGGVEVANELRKIDPNAKLIVASGDIEGEEMNNPTAFGFDFAIEKTIKRDEIKILFEKILGRKLT